MSVENTRQTIDSYLREMLSFGNYGDYMTEDVTLTFMGADNEIKGREAAQQFIDYAHQHAFQTDIQVKNKVYGENTAMVELEFVGTHIGEFQGIAPTNRQVRVPYVASYDLENDKIKTLRLYFPMEVLLGQISSQAQRAG